MTTPPDTISDSSSSRPARCQSCPFSGNRFVLGEGTPGGLAVVGEAPGYHEERVGRPFCGESGKLLRATLDQIGFHDPFITNALACRPPENATPKPAELDNCRPRLIAELEEARPQVILAVGATAMSTLFPNASKGILAERGIPRRHPYLNCWVVPTVHPAYVLRNPDAFRDFADDSLLAMTLMNNPAVEAPPRPLALVVRSEQVLRGLARRWADQPVVVDIETTGLNPRHDRIVAVGLCHDVDRVAIILEPDLKRLARPLEHLLRCTNSGGHNVGQFDSPFLKTQLDIDWVPTWDTMLMHYALDERNMGHGLKTLVSRLFLAPDYAVKMDDEQLKWEDVEKLKRYLAWDCSWTLRLADRLAPELLTENVAPPYVNVLVPAGYALGRMELSGIRVDVPYLSTLGDKFAEKGKQLELEIATEFDLPNFNLNSPKQVAELLWDRLELPHRDRSTGKEILEELDHPVATKVVEGRQLTKMKGTYVDGIIRRLEDNEFLFADFMLTGTRTGRLSCRNPNLQNIPKIVGTEIRDAFIAREGWTLIEADLSQMELRIAAIFSGDEYLINTYLTGGDIHRAVAAEVFGVPYGQVTFEQRYIAKYIDFGIIYGRQARSLTSDLKCSVAKAQQYLDRFMSRFQRLARWIREQKRRALLTGEVQTLFGRKRRFPLILELNRHDIENQAVNTPIQGTSSDCCLMSLVRIANRIEVEKIDWMRLLLTVHDSILVEAKKGREQDAAEILRYEMERQDLLPFEATVPFKVDIETGDRWGSLEKLPSSITLAVE